MVQIIKFQRSTANTAIASLPSGQPALHLGSTNGQVYQFIGNSSNQPVLINTPPFRFSLNKTFASSVNVANGSSYNLMSNINAADVSGATTTNFNYITTGFSYNTTNLSLIFPPFKDYTAYTIRIQLQGTITGTSGADRQFNIELRRGADNSLVLQDYIVKIDGTDLTGLTRAYPSFVNGLTDPYITGGLRIVLNNNSGVTITLTGFSLLIQGTSSNFIQ